MSRDALARELRVTYKAIYLGEKGKAKPSPMAQQRLEELEKRKNEKGLLQQAFLG